jgi:hypothetical protein
MAVDAAQAEIDLQRNLTEKDGIGLIAGAVRRCAAAQWNPRDAPKDWNAIFSMWLLLGESYRIERRSPVGTGARQGRSLVRVLHWTMYGIWANVWRTPVVADALATAIAEELPALEDRLGPSRSVIAAFLGRTAPAGAAAEWLSIRNHYRGGMKHDPTHNEFFPYDVLAPELAWCRASGQPVGRTSCVTVFPDHEQLTPSASAERVLVMLAENGWS